MPQYLGDFPVNGKVFIPWNTNAQDGASITRATDGTLKIYKGNLTAATWIAERSSLAGITSTEDFDGATGMHGDAIDLADNTDAGFWSAGGEYQVARTGMVIDGKTVNYFYATFSVERTNGVLALLKALIAGTSSLAGSIGSLGAQAKLDVNAEVDTAIADARLDELLAADSDIDGAAPPAVGSVVHEMLSKTAGSFTFDQTTDSLEAIRDKEADIDTKTTNLPSDPADQSLIIAATDAIMTRLGVPVAADLSADIASRLASASITLTSGKVTPIDVDGLTHAKAMEVIMAVLLNVAVPSGSTVAFKRRDGTTLSLTITYGTSKGERTESAIA